MFFFPIPDRAASAILQRMQIHADRKSDSPDEQRELERAARSDQPLWAAILAPHRDRLRRMVALRLDYREEKRE
jgi:hypothetical protein